MKPAEPFPRPSDPTTRGAATSRRPARRRPTSGRTKQRPRRRALWITVGAAVAVPVLAMFWYFGVGYVNTLVAVSGHGTHGVFAPGYETCTSTPTSNHGHTKTCAWHGVFIPDGNPQGMFDVTVPGSNGSRQGAWHVHLLPGTEAAVVPAATGGRISALIPAAAIIVFVLVSASVLRPFFRRRKKTRTPTPRHPDTPSDTGESTGLTTY